MTATPIREDDTAISLYERTIDAAVASVMNLLGDLRDGRPVPRQPLPPGRGTFYGRDSVAQLADVTDVRDPRRIAQLARAAFFPPRNTAFFRDGGRRYLVIPEGGETVLASGAHSVNEPRFTNDGMLP